jgi:hypothetical protein
MQTLIRAEGGQDQAERGHPDSEASDQQARRPQRHAADQFDVLGGGDLVRSLRRRSTAATTAHDPKKLIRRRQW